MRYNADGIGAIEFLLKVYYNLMFAKTTRKKARPSAKRGCWGCLTRIVAASMMFAIAAWAFYQIRLPDRTPLTRALFQGVTYERMVWEQPRAVLWHMVRVDLTTPGVRLFITPGNLDPTPPQMEFNARTTSQFLKEFGVQVAINGSFFDPFHANEAWDGLWEYYPKVGDPVNALGLVVSDGVAYSPEIYIPALCYGGGRAQIGLLECPAGTEQALAGNVWFVQNGWVQQPDPNPEPHPRTVVAVDTSGTQLWLLVVDGRQNGYSEGVTLAEAGQFLVAQGAWNALNLDGGGSSTLAAQEWWGAAVFNSPIHTRIPTRERPVANHLGIYAPPLQR